MTPASPFTAEMGQIRELLPRALIADRHWADRALSRPSGLRLQTRVLQRLLRSADERQRRQEALPTLSWDDSLPITACRREIIDAIQAHSVVIVAGQTGSGKTTQIPKFCLAAGRGITGLIGCTQPRRIAATTVAARIASELGQAPGQAVGYRVRFQDRTGRRTLIKVMTDGILLAEAHEDPLLLRYDTLIVDEAHERSLNIDFILGLLRSLLHRRNDLKVIITSATIDTEKFAKAFGGAPVIEVSGRMYPVEVRYLTSEHFGLAEEEGEAAPHLAMAVRALERLIAEGGRGDVLIFMPTEADIREARDLIEARRLRGVTVLPLYARLGPAEQVRVFAPAPGRKVIVATNIAETSITIPGIHYVIDTGLARIPRYSPRSRTTRMPVAPISRSSADQRMGRCGRVENGVCLRLYSEEEYQARPRFNAPEILRANLAEVALRMLALDLGELADFPFIDPPAAASVRDGFQLLEELGAIARGAGGDQQGERAPYRLTERGAMMARIPLDPRLSRMVIEARREGVLDDILVIAAALSGRDPRQRPVDQEKAADTAQRGFVDPLSDFVTLLTIWRRSREELPGEKSASRLRRFCKAHFLSPRAMREWRDIHAQMRVVCQDCGLLPAEGTAGDPGVQAAAARGTVPAAKRSNSRFSPRYAALHRSILAGHLGNIAHAKDPARDKGRYLATRGREVAIFPGSGLFRAAPEWIVAAEVVETSRVYARTVAAIDPAWLESVGGPLLRRTVREPRWDSQRGEVIASEQVTLFGLVIVPRRPVGYGRINPEEAATIFIRSALIEGELEEPPPFVEHNLAQVEAVRELEHRLRRRDLLMAGEVLEAFYRERIGAISDLRTLRRLIRNRGGDEFLRLSAEMLLRREPDGEEMARFPDWLTIGNRRYPLSYRFAPGEESDGVTMRVPLAEAARIAPEALSWGVPGLLSEKIEALLRALPKSFRRPLAPIAETAAVIWREMPRSEAGLAQTLSRFIAVRFGLSIPAAIWSEEALPPHLRTRIAITDDDGRDLSAGRDPALLSSAAAALAPTEKELEAVRRAYEREGLTRWDCDALPESLSLRGPSGRAFVLFPALVPESSGVCLRLLTDPASARNLHRQGVARLLRLYFRREVKFLERQLELPAESQRWTAPFGGARAVVSALVERTVAGRVVEAVRDAEAFERLAREAVNGLLPEGIQQRQAVLAAMAAHAEASARLAQLEQTIAGRGPLAAFLSRRRGDLVRLAPPDFIRHCAPQQLPHLPRYLRAVALRAERAQRDFDKDQARAAELRPFVAQWTRLQADLSPAASAAKRSALEEAAWLIEEFRVSLFAQELKTARPVSAKRLAGLLEEIAGMV